MSDTPRTDAFLKNEQENDWHAMSDFARQLERELNKAKQMIEAWSIRCEAHRQSKQLIDGVLTNVQKEREVLRAEVESLHEALKLTKKDL